MIGKKEIRPQIERKNIEDRWRKKLTSVVCGVNFHYLGVRTEGKQRKKENRVGIMNWQLAIGSSCSCPNEQA